MYGLMKTTAALVSCSRTLWTGEARGRTTDTTIYGRPLPRTACRWYECTTVWQDTWLCSLHVEPLTSCSVGLLSERPLSCCFGRQRDAQHQSPAGWRHRTGLHDDPYKNRTGRPQAMPFKLSVKAQSPVRLNSPPARSLLTVGDRGSHGWVRHYRLPRVVDGHAWHLLPRGRDEDLLCACWPALLYAHTHVHKPMLNILPISETLNFSSDTKREQSALCRP